MSAMDKTTNPHRIVPGSQFGWAPEVVPFETVPQLFWQRVEERNKGTAETVDRLGLPEYFAMEALVVRAQGEPAGWP